MLGERIDGPANLRSSVNGKVILTLNDNVLVETAPLLGKWFFVGVNVKLTDKQAKDFKIYPNTNLLSTEGKIIGKSKDTIELWLVGDGSGLIGAYTHFDNIKKHSIPERFLESELEKGHHDLSSLQNFIWTFNFQDFNFNKELKYRQLFIYESKLVDPSPRDRITLLINSKENLIGVFHSRKLNLNKYKSYKMDRGHYLTVIGDLDNKEINRIISERNNFDNSSD